MIHFNYDLKKCMLKRFITPYGLQKPPLKYVLRWKLGSLFKIRAKNLKTNDDFIVWLGHATFLIQLNGTTIDVNNGSYMR